MYYGFRDFSESFLARHPGYTIFPIRLNGSAIETFFSQLKHATSGQLSSANYSAARAAILTRGSVTQKKKSDTYRSSQLHIRHYRRLSIAESSIHMHVCHRLGEDVIVLMMIHLCHTHHHQY